MPPVNAQRLVIDSPARLDKVVVSFEGVGSREKARQAIARGKVFVGGAVATPADGGAVLAPGTVVELFMDRPGTSAEHAKARRAMVDNDVRILFEDDAILAIDKPAGLLTDAATREQREGPTARNAVNRYLKAAGGRAFVVHRIDRDTSGIVLFAKSKEAEDALKHQFETHTPERVYWLLVRGTPEPPTGIWADWMRWNGPQRIQELCDEGAEGAVLARAQYHTTRIFRGRGPSVSELEVQLVTGRRNQIRLHAGSRDHALLGERLYDRPDVRGSRTAWLPDGVQLGRQALHAARLTVVHPTTQEKLTLTSPLPADLRAALAVLEASREVEVLTGKRRPLPPEPPRGRRPAR